MRLYTNREKETPDTSNKEDHISEETHIQTTNLNSGLNINVNVYKDITKNDYYYEHFILDNALAI